MRWILAIILALSVTPVEATTRTIHVYRFRISSRVMPRETIDPPVWFAPMMDSYLQRTYRTNLPVRSDSSVYYDPGNHVGPLRIVNPYVK
jgi:hypothetical protein